MSETYHDLVAENDFPEDGKLAAVLGGWSVLVVKTDGGYNAVNDRCTHAASPLSTGRIRRGAIMCPLHGARFEAATGHCIGGAYANLRTFPVRVSEGRIAVAVPDEAPGPQERPVSV